jgi:predicted ferric reductase
VHLRELERLARDAPGLGVELVCSAERGHLHADELGPLDDHDVFICGPRRFTTDLRRQLRARGVALPRIHFEEFELR